MSQRPSPEERVFFFDYNFGRNIVPKALREVGAICEVHIDHFAQDAPDEEWLSIVGARGWIVMTKDVMIGRRWNEIQALQNANVGAFVFSSTGLTGKEMAAALIKALPHIYAFIDTQPRPFIAKIYKDSRIEPWK